VTVKPTFPFAVVSSVASSATVVTLFNGNGGVKVRTIFNESSAKLYVKFGVTASLTDYTVQVAAGGYYEFPQPALYNGLVTGIWDAANGNARLTEY
jgi:hypothetical protein